ncbi:hypothetical protein B0H11DRAFT_2230770 [Mycena galericulata]|nr:hypothetical protein B0H11DRAFT_2230770 [Mycena galericulata]
MDTQSADSTIAHGASHPGAFFPSSQNFVVAGGNFTSITHNTNSPLPPPDYLIIAMGDIDLMKEIRLHEDSGVASRKRAGQVRRIYSARVNGGKANMTVSLYEGKNAEKQWREDIEEYISFRHPNFLQLYGISSSHGIHAAVFHDDLIPVKHIMEMYSSPVATVYLWGYLDEEFRNARDYFYTISGSPLVAEVAFEDSGWVISQGVGVASSDVAGVVMPNGWTRVNGYDAVDARTARVIDSFNRECKPWLSQSNYVFNKLGIVSNLEDYLFAHLICYRLNFEACTNIAAPQVQGFLFMCPLSDLQSDLCSRFRHPASAAYWSLDLSGIQRLRNEEAELLGFPAIRLTTEVQGRYWDSSVYAGLQEFHRSKGFDPDTQDVARDLGYPLYRVTAPRAHGLLEESETINGNPDGSPPPSLTNTAILIKSFREKYAHHSSLIGSDGHFCRIILCLQLALMITIGISWLGLTN